MSYKINPNGRCRFPVPAEDAVCVVADRSVLNSPQTCIRPDDSGQFCSGDRS
jgi:hypothetical protein